MPQFFPAGAKGEMTFQGRSVLTVESALREQPLFSHLEKLRDLVQRVADRKAGYPEFVADLNRISIPAAWRNDIVNGLFDHADSAPKPIEPKPAGISSDIDKLLEMINPPDAGGSTLSPHLGRFLEEVGRDSTGFILKDGAAKALHQDLVKTLEMLRGSLLRYVSLADTLAFLSSLQRLSRAAKGREGQTVHLWSQIPEHPDDARALLVGERADAGADYAVAIVLLDADKRDAAYLVRLASLARSLGASLLLQTPGEELPAGEAIDALKAAAERGRAYFLGGGVASRVEGENCVFRSAAMAFLEGLIASRENVDFYEHRAMVLEDQDLITEKGSARATDRLLDNTQWGAVTAKRVNRVNGARNRSEASFPLLVPWEAA